MPVPTHRNRAATRSAALSVLLLVAAMPAQAQDAVPLELDRSKTILAEAGSVRIAGNFLIFTPQAAGRPLRLPLERVSCTAPNCPAELKDMAKAQDAQRLSKAATGFAIHGSNTIGELLMPKLIEKYLAGKLADAFSASEKKPEGMYHKIEFTPDGGPAQAIEIFAYGSTTGFKPLRDEASQLWMSSRRGTADEAREITATRRVDLYGAESEHVIALDGLAVIVNRSNPVGALSIAELADIFSGRVKDWANVPGSSRRGPIKIVRRDDNSGTTATFRDLVLLKSDWAPLAEALADSAELERKVAENPAAIGFVGIGYVLNTKALSIKTECGMAYPPTTFAIKTEEYPLSRRLFLYTVGPPSNPLARDILAFATSDAAQEVVKKESFIDTLIDVNGQPFEQQGGRMANMLLQANLQDREAARAFIDLVRFASRLSTTIHFGSSASTLDSKAERDINQLGDALISERIDRGKEFLIIGFADDQEAQAGKAAQISSDRALAVGRALQQKLGTQITIHNENIKSFGSAAPVACANDRGRRINRRVEVWVR